MNAAISKLVGYTGRIVWDADKPNGQPRHKLDVTRAKERFGFEAGVLLDEGLARTHAWMREHPEALG